MGKRDTSLEDLIAEFRRMLPPASGTARAIDRQESFEQIALHAIEDGYVEFSHEFTDFIEACLRRNA